MTRLLAKSLTMLAFRKMQQPEKFNFIFNITDTNTEIIRFNQSKYLWIKIVLMKSYFAETWNISVTFIVDVTRD